VGLSDQIWEWQFMQVVVGGIPATAVDSAVVWQYRQSSPIPPTWWAWEKGTGCSRATPAWVTYEERLTSTVNHAAPAARKRAPKMLSRESVLVLWWKIWLMRGSARPIDSPMKRGWTGRVCQRREQGQG
jgi:hypothetical protein